MPRKRMPIVEKKLAHIEKKIIITKEITGKSIYKPRPSQGKGMHHGTGMGNSKTHQWKFYIIDLPSQIVNTVFEEYKWR